MKVKFYFLITSLALYVVTAGAMAKPMPKDHLVLPGKSNNLVYGKVVTSLDARSYTYVQIDSGSEKHWAAGPKTVLKKGSMIAIDTGMPFKNFESKELRKKFDTIYFVSQFVTDNPEQNNKVVDPHAGMKMPDKNVTLKGIKKLQDGHTVSQILAEKSSLAGKSVSIRGKVVKYTAKVMGKNWLHIQDSSGPGKLVVSTDQQAKIGDQVIIKGIVATNQDLGYGYIYDVIVEKAAISVE